MKLKLYKSLFHVFSFFSDKTNGANPFVKYKLLLGTLIIGLAGTSAKAQKKETVSDTIPFRKPFHSKMASCYKVAIDSAKTPQISDTIDLKEVVVVAHKNNTNISCYAVQIVEMPAVKAKVPISIDSITSKPLSRNLTNELASIMCYGIVSSPNNNDPIYARRSKEMELDYNLVKIKPVSPMGNLNNFQEWVQNNIQYSEEMKKNKVEGEVTLSFVITKKGKLVNEKIVKGLSKEVDKEVLKVASKSKKWKAGKLQGDPVKTIVEITVKLNSNIE